MLSDAVDDGIILANPAFQVGRHKANRADRLTSAERVQKVRPMTWEQRDAFLAAAGPETRYVTLFAVLATAGLHPGEAFALKPGDIDWGERTVRVERAWNLGRVKPTKTYEERTVDLTPELVRALGKAKPPAIRLYDLRHTFASLLLAASAPITYVSAQLGHVDPSTTLRYNAR